MIQVVFSWQQENNSSLEPSVEYSFNAPQDVTVDELKEHFDNWLRSCGFLVD